MTEPGDIELTLGKAASLLNVTQPILRALVDEHVLPARLDRGHWRVKLADLPSRPVIETKARTLYRHALEQISDDLQRLDVEGEALRNDLAEALEHPGPPTMPLGNDLEALLSRRDSSYSELQSRLRVDVLSASLLNRSLRELERRP